MKGTIFQRPFEFNLLVDGESWRQGDAVRGTLVIKNHGTAEAAAALGGVHVALAYGLTRKVRKKEADAFKVIADAPCAEIPADGRFEWSFTTDRNCPISDGVGSLYLIYGAGAATEKLGQLQLPVTPEPYIEQYVDILRTAFRFVVKSSRAAKGPGRGAPKHVVEIKLAPPTAKAFANVEQLLFTAWFGEEGGLSVRYEFDVKKVQPTPGSAAVQKTQRDFAQEFAPAEYRLPNGKIDHVRVERAIEEVLRAIGWEPS